MQYDFSVRQIPNQLSAVSMHNRLRAAKAPVVVMGRFYSAMIERGLWVRQKELAAGLGVSTAHTSRMLAVARLPEVLLDAIADKPLSAAQVATPRAHAAGRREADLGARRTSFAWKHDGGYLRLSDHGTTSSA